MIQFCLHIFNLCNLPSDNAMSEAEVLWISLFFSCLFKIFRRARIMETLYLGNIGAATENSDETPSWSNQIRSRTKKAGIKCSSVLLQQSTIYQIILFNFSTILKHCKSCKLRKASN